MQGVVVPDGSGASQAHRKPKKKGLVVHTVNFTSCVSDADPRASRSSVLAYVASTGERAHVICLQEHKLNWDQIASLKQSLLVVGWRSYWTPCLYGPGGAPARALASWFVLSLIDLH